MTMRAQCSEEFSDAFASGCGGCVRVCACGKTHFDNTDNGWDWGEDELEAIEAQAKLQPGQYVARDGQVSTLTIDGKEIVLGCNCDTARNYERFITTHEVQIADYLRKRSKALRTRADLISLLEAP